LQILEDKPTFKTVTWSFSLAAEEPLKIIFVGELMLNLLAGARSNSAWRPIPDDTIASLREPIPQKGGQS